MTPEHEGVASLVMTARSGLPPRRKAGKPPVHHPRVLIAGGGVASLEALLALRALLEGRPAIEIVAPSREFVFRPLAVGEPFWLGEARRLDLEAIAREHAAHVRLGAVDIVQPDRATVVLQDGTELPYDALVIAIGARSVTWLGGAVSFAGSRDSRAIANILSELEEGRIERIAFAAPPAMGWPLPLYELALLTEAHAARNGVDVELTIVTPEHEPLEAFGPAGVRLLRELLAERGIALRPGATAERLQGGRLLLVGGDSVAADRVIALAGIEGRPLPGIPSDPAGFIPVDEHCRVAGLEGVWAAGDNISFPVKQGGLATQQADAAAEDIAAVFGAALEPAPFRPVLRAQLLTGEAPLYLSSGASGRSAAGFSPLFSPQSKIAGRYLGPYLDGRRHPGRPEVLTDIEPPSADLATQLAEQEEARELLLTLAGGAAHFGDERTARQYREAVEHVDGTFAAGGHTPQSKRTVKRPPGRS